jgi:hypothetical protein
VRAQDKDIESTQALAGLACTLGAECDRWGQLIEDDGGTEQACIVEPEPPTPIVWYRVLPDLNCPFGRCVLYEQQLTLDADGSLITLGSVQMPSQDWRSEGGLWFTRYGRGGEPLDSVLWDFSVPPPGIDVARHGALLRDRAGRAVFVSSRAVLPFDAARPLQASRFARGARPATAEPFFSTPKGWGTIAAFGPAGEWVVASQHTAAAGGPQASLTRYGRQGRMSWSRTWPEGSTIEEVHVTSDRDILVLTADLSAFARILYKLDERGRVAWRRVVSAFGDITHVAAASDGAIHLAVLSNGELFPSLHVQILDTSGQGATSWQLSDDGWAEPTLISDESGEVVLALPGSTSDWLPTLDWYAFAGRACRRTSYDLPSVGFGPDRVLVRTDRRGARFFATTQMVGQLREGGKP